MLEVEDLIRFANVYLAIKDKKFRYVYCNEKYAEFLNLDSPKQITGKYDSDFFSEDLVQLYRMGDSHVLNGKGHLFNVAEPISYNNNNMKILTSKNQIIKKNDNLLGIALTFFDISDVKFKSPLELFKYNTDKNYYEFTMGKEIAYFTPREYAIVKNLFLGLSTKKIASNLSLSSRTIEDYVQKIKNKLKCGHKHNIINTIMLYDK
jgi:DNA-binding CsgD family transcriptional regulator